MEGLSNFVDPVQGREGGLRKTPPVYYWGTQAWWSHLRKGLVLWEEGIRKLHLERVNYFIMSI
jgi:hypothetical protein